jgi:succinate dehydrogenase / fumarate reductase flavoprotein subunit
MGGIPTDIDGRVILDEKKTPLAGFYAAGECACVSVHGANRLGTNSLVDIVVFGRRAGLHMAKYVKEIDFLPLPPEPEAQEKAEISRIRHGNGGESVAEIRRVMQEEMMERASVFREEEGLRAAARTLKELQERYKRIQIQDKGRRFNTALLEALELGYLLDLAEVTVASALARTESRGGHYRQDHPKRDDGMWLKHTLAYRTEKEIALRYKPVVITRFQPEERKY